MYPEIKEHQKKYDRNFELLLKSVGTPIHRIYLKRERELNKLGIELRERRGIMTGDICPLWNSQNYFCGTAPNQTRCTGKFYQTKMLVKSEKKYVNVNKMLEKGEKTNKKVYLCDLREV